MTKRKQPELKLTEAQAVQVVRNGGLPEWVRGYALDAFYLLMFLNGVRLIFKTTVILGEVVILEATRAHYWLAAQMQNPTTELWSIVVWVALSGATGVYVFEAIRQGKLK